MLCSLALADDPEKPNKLKLGVVNIIKVYESSLSPEQRTFAEEQQRRHLQVTEEVEEGRMEFQRRLARWKALQKKIAEADAGEAATLWKEANDLRSNLLSLNREDTELRHRVRERATLAPDVRLHMMRMEDVLKAAKSVGGSRGIDFLFTDGEEKSSKHDEDETAILYARESMDYTDEVIEELRKMHGNGGGETEPVPRFGSFSPKYEPLFEKADLEEIQSFPLTKPEQVTPDQEPARRESSEE